MTKGLENVMGAGVGLVEHDQLCRE